MKISTVNSALWAAYGDAIGFITEMADATGVRRRIATAKVSQPVPWKRRVGGRVGPSVDLPRGCYSDDTQLRLATCRSIRGDGFFDVEAFSKVELPVWRSYYLGAGRATKAAARHFERKDVAWYSNFYHDAGVSYTKSGGNGAAMRIQPHVWADRSKDGLGYRLDVLRNALATHGHPRGFLGAMFHADCLAYTARHGVIPGPDAWMEMTISFGQTMRLLASDENLSRVWLPTWESTSSATLSEEISRIQKEHESDIRVVTASLDGNPENAYGEIVKRIGGFASESLGSGTKTALLSAVVSYLFHSKGIAAALAVTANQLGSDTDTIASMAGALMGLLEPAVPEIPPIDADYLASEAKRLDEVAQSQTAASFSYPDLLYWRVPKVPLDLVGLAGDEVVLAGLAKVSAVSAPHTLTNQDSVAWQWMRLEFGQTVLVKRRLPPPRLPKYAWPAKARESVRDLSVSARGNLSQSTRRLPQSAQPKRDNMQANLFEKRAPNGDRQAIRRRIDELTSEVIQSGFDPLVLGRNLLWLLDHSVNPIEFAIAFSSIIAKARAARRRSGHYSDAGEV